MPLTEIRITKQTGNRLVRMAFELEDIAARLRAAGYSIYGLQLAMDECRHAGDEIIRSFDAAGSERSRRVLRAAQG